MLVWYHGACKVLLRKTYLKTSTYPLKALSCLAVKSATLQTNDQWWRLSVLHTQLHFDSNLSLKLPKSAGVTGRSEQRQSVAAGWCRAKRACQACAVSGSLPALSAARSVTSVLNPKRIQLLLLSSSGGLIWLTNEHSPNEGNSPPQSHHSLYTFLAHFHSCLLDVFSTALSLIPPPLPRTLVSIFLHLSSSCAHCSHCLHLTSLPCWQPFTNCLPSLFLFLYSLSALLKWFAIQAVWATVKNILWWLFQFKILLYYLSTASASLCKEHYEPATCYSKSIVHI